MNRLLVLARHGQSEWNLKNLFTGWKDPGLTDLGIEEARAAGRRLNEMGVQFDIAFTSALGRAQDAYRGNPLVGGLIAAAAGAFLGSILPETQIENEVEARRESLERSIRAADV